jgi:hypothetical protein
VLGGQVCSTVFSIRQGIAPAGSFECESLLHPGLALLHPGLAGSKYVEIAVQKIPFFQNTFFLGLFLGTFLGPFLGSIFPGYFWVVFGGKYSSIFYSAGSIECIRGFVVVKQQ